MERMLTDREAERPVIGGCQLSAVFLVSNPTHGASAATEDP